MASIILGLVDSGARRVTTPGRTPPPVAGPVATICVPVRLVPILRNPIRLIRAWLSCGWLLDATSVDHLGRRLISSWTSVLGRRL